MDRGVMKQYERLRKPTKPRGVRSAEKYVYSNGVLFKQRERPHLAEMKFGSGCAQLKVDSAAGENFQDTHQECAECQDDRGSESVFVYSGASRKTGRWKKDAGEAVAWRLRMRQLIHHAGGILRGTLRSRLI